MSQRNSASDGSGSPRDVAPPAPGWWSRCCSASGIVVPLLVGHLRPETPTLWGFPFFYWFQFAMIPVVSVLTFVAFRLSLSATAQDRPTFGLPRRARRTAEDEPMKDVNGVELAIFLFFFLLVTVLGFLAARWRRADSLDSLDEWGLGGRGFGTFISWFLIGGDIYTAYTFIAVPATLYAGSVVGFFAVPYTIVLYPIIFIFLPRFWSVSHRHGYVTPADFVRGPLRLQAAGARGGGHRPARDDALHRAAARRHPGGARDDGHRRRRRLAPGSRRTCRCSSRSRCWRPTPTPRGCARRR